MAFEPTYILAGDRPVKTDVDPESGKIFIYAWDWKRRIFVKAPEYFDHIYRPSDQDITVLDEDAFQEKVDDLLFA